MYPSIMALFILKQTGSSWHGLIGCIARMHSLYLQIYPERCMLCNIDEHVHISYEQQLNQNVLEINSGELE